MRCHICNAALGETEIKFHKDHDDFDPCRTCLEIINNVFEDTLEEEDYREDYFEDITASPDALGYFGDPGYSG